MQNNVRRVQGRSAPNEVTLLVVSWLKEQRKKERTYKEIGDDLGVTKTEVQHLLNGGRNVGPKVEKGFAVKLYGGSRDALWAAAQEAAAARGETVVAEFPNLAWAIDVVRSRGSVPDATIAAVMAAAAAMGDLNPSLWVMAIEGIMEREAAKKASAKSPKVDRKR